MAENTKIEWGDHTFNPWIGCTKVSPACDHCYAEADFDKRRHVVKWGAGQPRKLTADSTWAMPRRWNAEAERLDIRYRVFCASLADVFDNEVPVQWRISLMKLIIETPHLDWLLLTKRIGNAAQMLETAFRAVHAQREGWADNVPPNVWVGATICNQAEADRDIPKLLATPAAKRFLSIEPLLDRVYIEDIPDPAGGVCLKPLVGLRWVGNGEGRCTTRSLGARIDWVIVGGESGHNARPMHPEWVRSLRNQCQPAGVPFLFKQWGEHIGGELQPNPDFPDCTGAWRFDQRGKRWHDPIESTKPSNQWEPIKFLKVGKKAAGRLLDGVTHNGMPT